MRGVMVVATAVLAAAAWFVPLPLRVAAPARLVAAQRVVSLTVSQQYARDASLRLDPVDGTFLTVSQTPAASFLQVAAAAASPDAEVLPYQAPSSVAVFRPEIVAALLGLGLAPARLEGTELPVTVEVAAGGDPAAVGLVLHVFDAASSQDVAGGRRVAGIGLMAADQTLACDTDPRASIAAAQREGADVIVVPAACGPISSEDDGHPIDMIVAGSLVEAVEALLARS